MDKVAAKPSFSLGFWKENGRFGFCLGRTAFRIELYFSDDSDKVFIDAMFRYKEKIEAAFTDQIIWERLENKKASRLKYEMSQEEKCNLHGRFNDEIYWEELITWYAQVMNKFYKAVYPVLEKVQKELQ